LCATVHEDLFGTARIAGAAGRGIDVVSSVIVKAIEAYTTAEP
jgi:hypothetical protein